jgi:NodT family efflux transporter outer membrane factor (OMF) lipoprotein
MRPLSTAFTGQTCALLLRCAALAAGVLLFAACSPIETKLPQLPNTTPAAWNGAAPADQALRPDLQNWWHAFDDATLNQLIESALHHNLGIQIAGERLKAARALRHRSRSEFWPNLNFRIYEETAPGGRTGYLEMGFDSIWEFGLFGRSQATSRTNLADENNAIVDEAAARVSVIAEVAKNYVELRAAQARAQVLDDLVAVRRKQVELNEARLRTLLASALEVDRVRAELQQALSDASEPQLTVIQTGQALAVLLGTNVPDPALATAAAQPRLPPLDIRQTPADLLRTRPEIRRAEQNVLHAAGELGIARADLYPKLGINGTLISSTSVTGDLSRPDRAVPLLGPMVTIPIVDWGARREVVNAREAALAAAVLAYREAVLEGVAEAQSALAQFDAKSVLVENAQKSLILSERAAQSAQTLQRIGLGDGLDAASASLVLAQSRLQQTSVLRERALSYIALYKAFGGTIPPLKAPAE